MSRRARSQVLRTVLFATLAAGVALGATSAARAQVLDVTVKDFFFGPNSVSGAPGDTITFLNAGSATHQIIAADGGFDSGPLAPGDSFSFALGDQPVAFACALHQSMTGTIAVALGGDIAATTAAPTIAAPVVVAATATTDSELAFTGSGTTSRAIFAATALALGAAALLARQRRRPPIAATISGDSLFPASERERRDRLRRPPAEF